VPLRETICGLPAALSLMDTSPVRVPVAVGVKVTLMVQLAAAATLPPHVLLAAKSPLATMLEIARGPVPLFVSITICGALVVPTV